jgi:hypothetical protein
MITIFNTLVELFVTGLFTALCLVGLTKLGLIPMICLTFHDKGEEEEEKDDLPY